MPARVAINGFGRVGRAAFRAAHERGAVWQVPIDEWLRPQARFAHLLRPENAELVDEIQEQVAAEWRSLCRRCEEGVPA
jgi:glyceraldehyde-3-phosphate dehydrogenase/erythrose-4-phosphate dehydrogenase